MRVPLEILNLNDDGFHLLVEVVVFGKPFKAVLDTGASKTVLDQTTILGLLDGAEGLVLTDRLSAGLGTTTMESFTLHLPLFKIGKFRIKHVEVAVIDLSTINHAYGAMEIEPVIGVIGGDMLMAYKAVINYEKAFVSFSHNKSIVG